MFNKYIGCDIWFQPKNYYLLAFHKLISCEIDVFIWMEALLPVPLLFQVSPSDSHAMIINNQRNHMPVGKYISVNYCKWNMEAVMFQNVYGYHDVYIIRVHFVYAHSQWEATLQCNVASHWLGTYIHKMIPVHHVLVYLGLTRNIWWLMRFILCYTRE